MASDGGQMGVTGVFQGLTLRVREVWAANLEQEMELIRNAVDDFPFVAMDTEFPGVVARPVGTFKSSREYQYKALKINVDMLKLIQLGLTLSDAEGNLPQHNGELCVWQFNFRGFNLNEDVYAQDSIELLKQSGIDFGVNEAAGIDVHRFGELLMASGVVLNDEIKWITFHSGYDFGYLVKARPPPGRGTALVCFQRLRGGRPPPYACSLACLLHRSLPRLGARRSPPSLALSARRWTTPQTPGSRC